MPCYVFSYRPLVFAAYDDDFIRRIHSFAEALKSYPRAVMFMQLGWQRQTPDAADAFAAKIKAALAEMKQLSITVLANSPDEAAVLQQHGLDAVFCHQNAFLDWKRYAVGRRKKLFDAIYIARITPFKRHQLAGKVRNLALVGSFSERERGYAETILSSVPHLAYFPKIHSWNIKYIIAKSGCGLCLSSEEGAMFVSAEYLLCGKPVVNTANIGGRDQMFPDFAVKNVPDSPEAVAEAVEAWNAAPPDPYAVREAIIAKMRLHRNRLRMLLGKAIYGEKNGTVKPFSGTLPHKLGLRCRKSPSALLFHGLVDSIR